MTLLEIHEHVTNLVRKYYQFRKPKIFRMLKPGVYFKSLNAAMAALKIKEGTKPEIRQIKAKLIGDAVYSEAEKRSDLYQVYIASHPIDALANLIQKQFPNVSYDSLLAINEIDEGRSESTISPFNLIGGISGFVSALVIFVPSEYLSAEIKQASFWWIVLVFGYFSFLFGVVAINANKDRVNRKRVKDVLTYCIEAQKVNNNAQTMPTD